MRSSSTSPASTFSARSRIDAALLPESPTLRSSSIDSASTACGRGRSVEQRGEPSVDRGRGLARELLVTDRSRQLGEVRLGRLRALQVGHAVRLQRAPQHRITLRELARALLRPSREPSPSRQSARSEPLGSAPDTRARRRRRSRAAPSRPTSGAPRSGTRTRSGTPPASTVSSARSPANALPHDPAAHRPVGVEPHRVGPQHDPHRDRALAPAPSTGSTPHGVREAVGARSHRRRRARSRGTSAVHSSAGCRHTSAAAPACTTRPARIITMRSASANASS